MGGKWEGGGAITFSSGHHFLNPPRSRGAWSLARGLALGALPSLPCTSTLQQTPSPCNAATLKDVALSDAPTHALDPKRLLGLPLGEHGTVHVEMFPTLHDP